MSDIFGGGGIFAGTEPPAWLTNMTRQEPGLLGDIFGQLVGGLGKSAEIAMQRASDKQDDGEDTNWIKELPGSIQPGMFEARMNIQNPLWKQQLQQAQLGMAAQGMQIKANQMLIDSHQHQLAMEDHDMSALSEYMRTHNTPELRRDGTGIPTLYLPHYQESLQHILQMDANSTQRQAELNTRMEFQKGVEEMGKYSNAVAAEWGRNLTTGAPITADMMAGLGKALDTYRAADVAKNAMMTQFQQSYNELKGYDSHEAEKYAPFYGKPVTADNLSAIDASLATAKAGATAKSVRVQQFTKSLDLLQAANAKKAGDYYDWIGKPDVPMDVIQKMEGDLHDEQEKTKAETLAKEPLVKPEVPRALLGKETTIRENIKDLQKEINQLDLTPNAQGYVDKKIILTGKLNAANIALNKIIDQIEAVTQPMTRKQANEQALARGTPLIGPPASAAQPPPAGGLRVISSRQISPGETAAPAITAAVTAPTAAAPAATAPVVAAAPAAPVATTEYPPAFPVPRVSPALPPVPQPISRVSRPVQGPAYTPPAYVPPAPPPVTPRAVAPVAPAVNPVSTAVTNAVVRSLPASVLAAVAKAAPAAVPAPSAPASIPQITIPDVAKAEELYRAGRISRTDLLKIYDQLDALKNSRAYGGIRNPHNYDRSDPEWMKPKVRSNYGRGVMARDRPAPSIFE